MDIIKYCLIALGALSVILLLKEIKKEYALYAMIAAGLLFIGICAKDIAPIFAYMEELTERTKGYGKTDVILKGAASAVITAFTCEICKDAGESGLASKVNLCGKAAVLAMSLPLLKELTAIALGILN
ncbi:MAG: hypothetical protein E7665_04165 [Ruminococcaceae bacterium]|nr:hypothetical protein [Oscillospiraceae bacterium]